MLAQSKLLHVRLNFSTWNTYKVCQEIFFSHVMIISMYIYQYNASANTANIQDTINLHSKVTQIFMGDRFEKLLDLSANTSI